jgi:hypothetical protein
MEEEADEEDCWWDVVHWWWESAGTRRQAGGARRIYLPRAHRANSSLATSLSDLCAFQRTLGAPKMASKVHDMSTTNRISVMSSMFNDMSCTFEASFMMISNPGLDDLVSVYFDCSNVAHDYSENLNSLCAADIKKWRQLHYARRRRKKGCDWCVVKVVTSLRLTELVMHVCIDINILWHRSSLRYLICI